MDVVLALVVCFLMVSMTAVQSQRGPVNALKKVGDSVTLKCVTVNNNCHQVEWQKVEGLQSPKLVYRNGVGMLNNDLYPTQRYSVNSTVGCSLTITQLVIIDSGRFICMHAADSGEETRTAILVVINVTESCLSNVTSNALDEGDAYSLRCAINIPPKSVEPSIVTLSFHNKTVGEDETTDENQPQTVKITLTGIAKKETIKQRVCRASFSPNTQTNYDNTTAILDVCTTQQLDPVESSTFSTPGPYSKGDTVGYTTDGHPSSTLNWTHSNSEDGVHNGTTGDARDKYTSTATKMVTDGTASQTTPTEGSSLPAGNGTMRKLNSSERQDAEAADCGPGYVVIVVCCCLFGGCVIGCVCYAGLKDKESPIYVRKKKKNDYPVANIFISVSRHGPDKGITVGLRCAADGHPSPTFKSTHLTSGDVLNGDTLVITGDDGDKYTCTATNTFKGRVPSQNITTELTSPPPEDGDTLVIMGDSGDKCICTGKDTFKGKVASQSCKSDCIAGAACCACRGIIGWLTWLCSKKKNADYPVENIFISVSPPGPDDGIAIRCTADGHPSPTFKWTIEKSGDVVDGDTLLSNGYVGVKYTCTATNTVNGKETSQNITIEFTSPPPEALWPGGIAGVVTGIITAGGVVVGVVIVGWEKVWWLHPKEKNDEDGETADVPSKASGPPTSNVTLNSEVP